MSEKVEVKRKIYGKNSFSSVVDTTFRELVPSDSVDSVDTVSVDQFFINYNELFYDIPTEGENNSHLYLVNKSSEILGISYQDLITELNQLRQENTSLKNQLFTLTNG